MKIYVGKNTGKNGKFLYFCTLFLNKQKTIEK